MRYLRVLGDIMLMLAVFMACTITVIGLPVLIFSKLVQPRSAPVASQTDYFPPQEE